jgi:hypothetical protein
MTIKIRRRNTWPAVLYANETKSLVWREELTLREFENVVLRKIFGPKRVR